jgi:hypothetical protein
MKEVIALLREAINILESAEGGPVLGSKKKKSYNAKFIVRKQTEKALLVQFLEPAPTEEVWLPKKVVDNLKEIEAEIYTAYLPQWLIDEKINNR